MIADGKPAYPLAQRAHEACALVTADEREPCGLQMTPSDMVVAMTQPAGRHLDQHLTGGWTV